jgi:hypothetical protein
MDEKFLLESQVNLNAIFGGSIIVPGFTGSFYNSYQTNTITSGESQYQENALTWQAYPQDPPSYAGVQCINMLSLTGVNPSFSPENGILAEYGYPIADPGPSPTVPGQLVAFQG